MIFGFGKRRVPEPPPVAAVSVSERGLVRPENEDHVLCALGKSVFCVADGMGGGAEGERASEIVCREIRMMINVVEDDFETRVAAVMRALVDANHVIFEYARDRGFAQMGSTAAVLVLDPADRSRGAVIHVGDSRVYRLRGGLASVLTKDHSVGFELGDFAGARSAEFRDRANPLSHVLTRAVGVLPELQCERHEVDVRSGDRYVVCSDGVHDVISDARLAIFAGGGNLEASRLRLSTEIEKAGAPDNYSFIIVQT